MYTVSVLGACGGIGQPLCLLLKSYGDLIGQLNLYDVFDPAGVAEDLSHIPTKSIVKSFTSDKLEQALTGADVVVIPAGVPRKPNMTRNDLYTVNAKIVHNLIEGVAQFCPQAVVALITNPVNSLVPLSATILNNKGINASKKLIGVTSLDVLRTQTFTGRALGLDPEEMCGDCICGHSGTTIVPLINNPSLSEEDINQLCDKISNAGTAVVNAKNGAGSATLSMASAGFRTVKAILKGLNGSEGIVECAFVKSELTSASYFASPVEFGPEGVKSVLPLPELTPQQQNMIDAAIPILQQDIQKGLDFFNQ